MPFFVVFKVNHTYGSPMEFRTTSGGHGSWGQLSVGAEPPAASEERGPLPAGWGPPTAQRPRPPPHQHQQQQQAAPRAQSDQGDKTSSEGGSSGAKSGSVSTEVTTRAGGSEDLGVELTPTFDPPAGLEDAFNREMAACMAGFEDRLGAMFADKLGTVFDERVEAMFRRSERVVDTQSAPARGTAGVTAGSDGAASEDNVVSRSASEEDSTATL